MESTSRQPGPGPPTSSCCASAAALPRAGYRKHSSRLGPWAGFGLLAGFAALTEPSVRRDLHFLLVLAAWRLFRDRPAFPRSPPTGPAGDGRGNFSLDHPQRPGLSSLHPHARQHGPRNVDGQQRLRHSLDQRRARTRSMTPPSWPPTTPASWPTCIASRSRQSLHPRPSRMVCVDVSAAAPSISGPATGASIATTSRWSRRTPPTFPSPLLYAARPSRNSAGVARNTV